MTWTVFVTWGCQLGGGNEKECMLMVPPDLGAAPARRGAPAASKPTAAPASTSRRVNGAPPVGTTVPASETDKAIILLLVAPLMEPYGKCRPGMRACQHHLSESRYRPRGAGVYTSRRRSMTSSPPQCGGTALAVARR